MKYYAVTDDPNELLHYGRLGMKWGQHIFVGPKSLSYKKALGKLRSSAQKTVKSAKAAVQKSKTQRAINKQQKQQEKFNKAVAKAQKRIAVTENLSRLDTLRRYEKADERAAKNEAFMLKTEAKKERIANRQERKYAKNERKMEKYMQEAREGRLRYGKLSEEQVGRIRDRLAFENAARAMGGREKAKFRTRLKEAAQEGILQGVVQGTAAGMKEVAVAKVQNRLKNKRVLDKNNRQEAQRQKEATRIKNKRTKKEIREDLKQEAYEAQVESGAGVLQRSKILHPFTNTNAGKMLQQAEIRKKLNSQKAEYQLLYDKKGNETKLNKQVQALENKKHERELARDEEKFLLEESRNARRTERQNAENEAREERKRFLEGYNEYYYGLPAGSGDKNKGGGQQQQKKIDSKELSSTGKWFEQKYVKGQTIQEEARNKDKKEAERKEITEQRNELKRIQAERNKRQEEQDAEYERRKREREAASERRKQEREAKRQKDEQARKEYQADIMRQIAAHQREQQAQRESREQKDKIWDEQLRRMTSSSATKYDQPTTVTPSKPRNKTYGKGKPRKR